MKSIASSLRKLDLLLEAPTSVRRNKASIFQSNPAQGTLTTAELLDDKKTKGDAGQSMSGDITRVAGAKTQEMIAAFFQQMYMVSADSNETSEHTADVVVKVTSMEEDGQLTLLNTINGTLEKPPGMSGDTLTFGIEAKKGAGDFDGEGIQTNQQMFEQKLNENAGFVIEHSTNETFLFCYLNNPEGRDLKKIMEYYGQDDYAMVDASALWPDAIDANRTSNVMQADGTTRSQNRLVKRVTYEQLERVIKAQSPASETLRFVGEESVLNSMMKVRVNEKELKRSYQAERRQKLAENLRVLGVGGITPEILNQLQRSYNKYGIPLFCTQFNMTSKSGYSGLPEILPLRRITQTDIVEDVVSTIYHPKLIQPSADNGNNPLLGDLAFFKYKGGTFVHIPDPAMAGTMPPGGRQGEEHEGLFERTLPAASTIGKLARGLERLNKLYDSLLKGGVLDNLVDIANNGLVVDGERYVSADDWEASFGQGASGVPPRLPVPPLDIPSDPEHFAPTDQETREAIELMDRYEATKRETGGDALDLDPQALSNDVDSLAGEDDSWLSQQISKDELEDYRVQMSQSINRELESLGTTANEWTALEKILQDAGIRKKSEQNKLMSELEGEPGLSKELKKAYNAWLADVKNGRGGTPFVIPESIRLRFTEILLANKYSMSRILL